MTSNIETECHSTATPHGRSSWVAQATRTLVAAWGRRARARKGA